MLLGETDRVIRLTDRFAACFTDVRASELVEHGVGTMLLQRVVGIARGYEDVNDHDDLRHDPVFAVLAGKLAAKRSDCAPLAGKSTLNRLELSKPEPTRYHKVSHDPAAIEALFVDMFLEAHRRPPAQIILDPVPLGPSPYLRRVGVHHFTFEACSGFTRVTACWIAQPPNGRLCHEASIRMVTQPNRSSATRSYRQLPGWIPPPLVNRAVGAH